MKAVIVHIDSHHIPLGKTYKSLSAAKGAMTRAKTHAGGPKYPAGEFAAMTLEDFRMADTEITVKSLMNGKEVKIRKSERGGCTDPSTERYWSM